MILDCDFERSREGVGGCGEDGYDGGCAEAFLLEGCEGGGGFVGAGEEGEGFQKAGLEDGI